MTSEAHSLEEFETVLQTSTSEEILVVKSLLESADIPFITEGEVMNELFPADTMVTLFNPQYMVSFNVPKDYAQEARDLIGARFDENELRKMEEEVNELAEGESTDQDTAT